MRISPLRSFLPYIAIGLVVVIAGLLETLPLPFWLWWAIPPLELRYSSAYFEATLHWKDPAAVMRIKWVLKWAPNRPPDFASSADVVAENPWNSEHFELPMHLSPEAQRAGWTGLMESSDQTIKASELKAYLQAEFYGGRTFWELLEPPLWTALLSILTGLGIREWIVSERERRKRAEESEHYWTQILSGDPTRRTFKGRLKTRLVGPLQRLLRSMLRFRLSNASSSSQAMLGSHARQTSTEEFPNLPHSLPPAQTQLTPAIASTMPKEPTGDTQSSLFESAPGLATAASSSGKHSRSSNANASPKARSIFPGASSDRATKDASISWDESQWID